MSDYFMKVGKPGSATTLSSPGFNIGDTSITVGSTANWPTDTKVAFAIDRAEIVAGQEVQIAGTYTEWTGQVSGPTTIASMAISADSPNSAQNYAAGSLTRVYIPVSATRENKLIEGITQFANQDGTLKAASIDSSLATVNPPAYYRFTGEIATCALRTAPAGWLLCNGAAVSRSTYSALFAALMPSLGTFTITIASPGLITLNSHGLETSQGVYITTTGALPTGLTTNTQYFVIKNDANSFWLATSQANADAGTKINTSGSQSGTHTLVFCPTGVGDGSTTFNVPDLRGRVIVGLDASQTEFNTLGKNIGSKTHTLTINEMPSHDHDIRYSGSAGGTASMTTGATSGVFTSGAVQSKGGGQPHNNIQPSTALNHIIKT